MSSIAAVDWGGTWIRVGVVEDGALRYRERLRRPDLLDDQYLAIAELVRAGEVSTGRPVEAVGVGVAGVLQLGVVMTASNIGITTPTDVAAALTGLSNRPVRVVNDVQATALGLATRWPDGLTAVLTMGTGIGGAVVLDGRLVIGNGGAGDFGHVPIEIDGRRCVCGGHGCLEEYASGRVLAAAADALAADVPELAERRAARALHAGDLQDVATAGEPRAIAALDAAAGAFAAGVRAVVAALDPTRIVLAGALLAPDTEFGRRLRAAWDERRPAWCRTALLHAVADEDAALLGAALLAQALGTTA